MVLFHGAAGFNLWIKPVVSSQLTPNPNHVSVFAKHGAQHGAEVCIAV